MPAQHCFRFHDQQGISPGRAPTRQPDDHRAVAPVEFGPFHVAVQHQELLSQQGVLDDQIVSAARDIAERPAYWRIHDRLGPRAQVSNQQLAELAEVTTDELGEQHFRPFAACRRERPHSTSSMLCSKYGRMSFSSSTGILHDYWRQAA